MIGPRETGRSDVDDAATRTAQREAIARLTEIADQINAGHVPAGARACGPGSRVIVGPAEIDEPEAGA